MRIRQWVGHREGNEETWEGQGERVEFLKVGKRMREGIKGER